MHAARQKLCKSLDAEFVVDGLNFLYNYKLYKRCFSASVESKFCKILLGIFFNDIIGLILSLQESCCYICLVPSLMCLACFLKEKKFIKNTFKLHMLNKKNDIIFSQI